MATHSSDQKSAALRAMPVEVFAQLGAPSLAYLRAVEVDGVSAYGIFAANGQPMGVLETREDAVTAARDNELTLVSVH